MKDIFGKMKRPVVDYYLFCVLVYVLMAPAWQRFALLVGYKGSGEITGLHNFMMSVMLVLVATTLRQWQPKIRVVSWLLLIAGLFVELKYLVEHYDSILSKYLLIVLALISLLVSCWSTLVFFIGFDAEKYKSLSKKMVKSFFVTATLFFIFVVLLGRYYASGIKRITSSGSLFVPGGLSYAQMEVLINEKIWQANMLLTLLTVLMTLLLFLFYRKVKTRLLPSAS